MAESPTVILIPGTHGNPGQVAPMLGGQVTAWRATKGFYYANNLDDPFNDIPSGAFYLDALLKATPGPKIVLAHSLGAIVASWWIQYYGPTSTVRPSDLSFILLGNSARKYGGYYPQHDFTIGDGLGGTDPNSADGTQLPVVDITNSRYPVTDIALQYDGWADWPNLTDTGHAVDLATFGTWTWHLFYNFIPLDREDYLRYTEGNVTYILAPNPNGSDSVAEAGYSRVMGSPSHPVITTAPTVSSSASSSTGIPTYKHETVYTLRCVDMGKADPMKTFLSGYLENSTPISYPAKPKGSSVPAGVVALDAVIKRLQTPAVIVGHSMGAQVCSEWLRIHGGDADAPAPEMLRFILLGNPQRKYGGKITGTSWGWTTLPVTPNNTKYQVTDIARQGDTFANYDNYPNTTHPRGLIQGVYGMIVDHMDYSTVWINSPDNSTRTVEGSTTYLLAP